MKLKRIMSTMLATCFLMGAMIGDVNMVWGAELAKSPIYITVGQGNGYDFNTISEAVNSIKAIPNEKNPATIKIAGGTYIESIEVDKPYVKFVKSDSNEVIISYDKATGHEDSTKNFGTQKTATVTITENAVGFEAEGIIFKNSYNIDNTQREQSQAVALVSSADKVIFDNCKFIGRQDTLFLKGASQGQDVYGKANPARVYLSNCYVEGTVDFIFGDATAYFDNCTLNMAYYKNGGHFTAANTTLFNIGYVFNKCKLTVDKSYTAQEAEKIDLGRPWQGDNNYPNYGSHTVYLNCTMPEIYNEAGFSVWDKATMTNKIRYMEYNSKSAKAKAVDLSKRADFVKILTEEQAKVYSAYNVLKGTDGWNPTNADIDTNKAVMDITLKEYDINIPMGESGSVIPFVLPTNASNYAISYSSSDTTVASVNSKGDITALKEGSAKIFATSENGFGTYANVNVTAPRTPIPTLDTVSINSKEVLYPEQPITANYSYTLDSDNKIDKALIRWYAIKGNDKILLKEGVGSDYASYTPTNADIGYNIMLGVKPATTTTYGEYGEEKQYTTKTPVAMPEGTVPEIYLRDGFVGGTSKWSLTGDWSEVKSDANVLLSPSDDNKNPCKAVYKNSAKWGNISLDTKFRFNPEGNGLSSDDYFDIYTAYNEDTYYKLRVVRGGNTKSLIVSLYKAVDGEETLLAEDKTTLKNLVPQNSGNDNPYFNIKQTNNSGNINISLTLENATTPLMSLKAVDSEPLTGGTVAFEGAGKPDIWLIDNVVVEEVPFVDSSNKIRIYLAGDSTVKSYGDDNTIGGWGEYLQYYFNDSVEIHNMAEGGRSSRSFINQGRLSEIMSEIRPGDYLFIQFGHNDGLTTDNARVEHSVMLGEADSNGIYPTIAAVKTATPQRIIDFYKDTDYPYSSEFYPYESGTYKWYLSQYVKEARQKGAIPVLITPVCRVFFDSEGKITPHHGENNGYVNAVIQVAEEMDCQFVDMFEITKSMYESYGVMVTQGLQNVKADGTMDLTHYNKFGSNIVTSKLIEALAAENLPLANYTKNSSKYVAKTDDLKTANLFVVGDGYSASGTDNEEYAIKSEGFGDYLEQYLSKQITVKNLALDGASAKSYTKTDNYKELFDTVVEGDYVMINFGAEDGNNKNSDDWLNVYTDPSGSVETQGSFKNYIYEYYIKPLVAKKAVPIIITPSNARAYNTDGSVKDTVGLYDDALKELVVDNQLYFVDLTTISKDLYGNMGAEGSKALNALSVKKGVDNKHYNGFGADTVAKHILSNMKFSSATLKNYIDDNKLTTGSKLTKADFVVALMDIMNDKINASGNNFNDVVKGKYYFEAIAKAKTMNIISGNSSGNFNPENALSKAEMDEILKNALIYKGIPTDRLSDVYAMEGENASFEIGWWALNRLYEVIYK